MDKNSKIFIAGHNGMVGSSILRHYKAGGWNNIVVRSSKELDLRDQKSVRTFFETEKPELVIIAAAKVGGILANNTYRAEFLYDNLMIETNIIHAAYETGVKKLLFLGSSCIYPKMAPQPLKEESLLSGFLEYTNEPYAIAKIAGIKLFSLMPTNLYGTYDNFDLQTSHVLPALIRKFHEAKLNNSESVVVWGTGSPKREFLYVEDLADAVYFIMDKINAKDLYENGISHLNVGSGEDLTIGELAGMISQIVGYKGKIEFDTSKPDGTPRKLMDVSRINNLGWKYKTSLHDGILKSYEWYLKNS